MNESPNSNRTQAPVNVIVPGTSQPFVLRLIWFIFVGWWASAIAISIAYGLMLTIVLLPVGIWLLHRVPYIQTLRDRTREFVVSRGADGSTTMYAVNIEQRPFVIRAIWFVLVGYWLTALWLSAAWLISLGFVTIPISVWMIDRAPGILTLQRY